MKLFLMPFILLSFFIPKALCQNLSIYDIKDGISIGNGLQLKSTPNGWTFINSKGIQSKDYYKHIIGIKNGVISYCNDPDQHSGGDVVGTYCKDSEKYIHLFQIMKDLGEIDNFSSLGDLKNIFDGRFYLDVYIDNYFNVERTQVIPLESIGYASKNGKFAVVNIIGEIITAFKYDNTNFNSYTETLKNGVEKRNYVFVNPHSGEETFKTSDSLIKFWDMQRYITKNIPTSKYYLFINSKKQHIPRHFTSVIQPPVNSSLFTYNGSVYSKEATKEYKGFLDQNLNDITPKIASNSKLLPMTNFFNGHCLALEVIEDEIGKKPNGDTFYIKKGSFRFKIINETFETFKMLPEIKSCGVQAFNKYGNVIVSDNDCEFVIDYNGNYIIPPTTIDNRIKEVYEGIYRVLDYSGDRLKAVKDGQSIENFYNQKGERLIPSKIVENYGDNWHSEFSYYRFLECREFNLIPYPSNYDYGQYRYDNYMLILDKENNIIKSRL